MLSGHNVEPSLDSIIGATSLKTSFEATSLEEHGCIVCDEPTDPEDKFFCETCVSVFSTD